MSVTEHLAGPNRVEQGPKGESMSKDRLRPGDRVRVMYTNLRGETFEEGEATLIEPYLGDVSCWLVHFDGDPPGVNFERDVSEMIVLAADPEKGSNP